MKKIARWSGKRKICFWSLIAVFVLLAGVASVFSIYPAKLYGRGYTPLTDEQRKILAERFSGFVENGKNGVYKREISPSKPLNFITHYSGAEDVEAVWDAVPEEVRAISALLLIDANQLTAGRTDAGDPFAGLIKTAGECERLGIPFAFQYLNGETQYEAMMPLKTIEERFLGYSGFLGLNCAETYNAEQWRGPLEGNLSFYIAESIRFTGENGLFFFWTDTNLFGENGAFLDWLERDEYLYDALETYGKHVMMQNKESYGSSSSLALMKGLYLSGLIGGFGVSTDWWHWQVSDYRSPFGEKDEIIDSEWERIVQYPEAMQTMSFALAAASGGFLFKNEADFYSVAVTREKDGGIDARRTVTMQFLTLPFFRKILSGEFPIPTREEVLSRTKAVVLGGENYPAGWGKNAGSVKNPEFDFALSALYPASPRFGQLALLPKNLRKKERAEFLSRGVALLNERVDSDAVAAYAFGDVRGDAFLANGGDVWYYVNPAENTRATRFATAETKFSGAKSFTIEAEEHTFAMIREESDALRIHLNNYRLDKIAECAVWDGQGDVKDFLWDVITVGEDGAPRGGNDRALRRTTVSVDMGADFDGQPVFAEPDGASRPYTIELFEYSEETHVLKISILHNGAADFTIKTPAGARRETAKAPISEPETTPGDSGGVAALRSLLSECAAKLDPYGYTETSYRLFYGAYRKAELLLPDGAGSDAERKDAEAALRAAETRLIPIKAEAALLKAYVSLPPGKRSEAGDKAFDGLIRELLSPTEYYYGKEKELTLEKWFWRGAYDDALYERKTKRIAFYREKLTKVFKGLEEECV